MVFPNPLFFLQHFSAKAKTKLEQANEQNTKKDFIIKPITKIKTIGIQKRMFK